MKVCTIRLRFLSTTTAILFVTTWGSYLSSWRYFFITGKIKRPLHERDKIKNVQSYFANNLTSFLSGKQIPLKYTPLLRTPAYLIYFISTVYLEHYKSSLSYSVWWVENGNKEKLIEDWVQNE